MAIQSYHDQYTIFPPGTVGEPERPVEERFSWLIALLPYVEEESTYKQIDLTNPWNSAGNQTGVWRRVRCFRCPSELNQETEGEPALTHYVGIAGVGLDAARLPVTDSRAGFFGYDRRITTKDIKDGTSNTLVVVETAASLGPWAGGGPATVRGLDSEDTPYVGHARQFGRVHNTRPLMFQKPPVMAQVLLGDGSVRSLSDSISASTFEALATIAGGDTVGEDF